MKWYQWVLKDYVWKYKQLYKSTKLIIRVVTFKGTFDFVSSTFDFRPGLITWVKLQNQSWRILVAKISPALHLNLIWPNSRWKVSIATLSRCWPGEHMMLLALSEGLQFILMERNYQYVCNSCIECLWLMPYLYLLWGPIVWRLISTNLSLLFLEHPVIKLLTKRIKLYFLLSSLIGSCVYSLPRAFPSSTQSVFKSV